MTDIYCAVCDTELQVIRVRTTPAAELCDRLHCPACEPAPPPAYMPDWLEGRLEWVQPKDLAHPTVRRVT